MDGQLPQPENQVIIVKSSSNIFKNAVFIPVITLLLGFALGFLAKSILPLNKAPVPTQKATLSSTPKPAIDESKLPISLSLLTNPIIGEWRGGVGGKLIKKDEHTFTLANDKGDSITITDTTTAGTKFQAIFFDKTNKNKQTSLNAIPLGSTLVGDFFIFQGGPNTPVGSMFVKQ